MRLAAAGVPSPAADASWLVAAALGVDGGRLGALRAARAPLPPGVADRLEPLVARRGTREPLQHVLGTAPFRRLELAVGPGVLVPRPETELLVDPVLAHLAAAPAPAGTPPEVVDLCAGSGALALSVAAEAPGCAVTAVELDRTALSWLRRNVAAAGEPGTRVQVVPADVRDVRLPQDGALAPLAGRTSAVVSNPPYLPDAAAGSLPPEVRADPAVALLGGPDGLDLVRAVVALAGRLLHAGGLLVCEHGDDQGEQVAALLAAGGAWTDVVGHADLVGRPRHVVARRAGSPA